MTRINYRRYDVKGSEALSQFTELVETRDGNVLVPALAFGKAVRNLTGPQLRALENLLTEFHAHPRSSSPGEYLVAAHNRSVAMNDNHVELDLVSLESREHYVANGWYLPQGEAIES